ncbi:RNA polymerase sigma factor [Chromatocurvus halotolerans]|uniref:RNA polymerase sigma-70 factor (ECF subfamily) n=1 Tax=Chromatocurvus halotolerans TaxID=1132028 RepID=A0A4R2KXP0_9GAMM|nr:RNA polymerase sigma factor [Chromatocurvus halotolerans]TCO77842.1 RNA polymerase sigma-70 factor (ECF subfamily) [Chromatocurvus halotolerans]
MSQAALVDAMRAGDEAAFSQAVRCYTPSMLAAVWGLCDPATAEDVVQESWLRVIEAIHGFEARATLKTWLCSIAVNEARQRLRKSRREIPMDLDSASASPMEERFTSGGAWLVPPTAWAEHAVESLLERDSLQQCLEKHIAALSEDQRSVLALRDIQQMPVEDICNILQLSHSNLRVLLHRARHRIFAMVDHFMETGEC